MASSIDNGFNGSMPNNGNVSDEQMRNFLLQARQNPQQLENYLKRTNPQAYNMACKIRNSPNPRAIIAEMARTSNINPAILQLLGINF